jgi:hypothetical protein
MYIIYIYNDYNCGTVWGDKEEGERETELIWGVIHCVYIRKLTESC